MVVLVATNASGWVAVAMAALLTAGPAAAQLPEASDGLPFRTEGPLDDMVPSLNGGGELGPAAFESKGPEDLAPVQNADDLEVPMPAPPAPPPPLVDAEALLASIVAGQPPPEAAWSTAPRAPPAEEVPGTGEAAGTDDAGAAPAPPADVAPAVAPEAAPGEAPGEEPSPDAGPSARAMAAAAAVGLGLLALGAVAFPWKALLRAVLAFLFSHVAADKALAQPTRQRLLAYVEANPGASLQEMQAGLGVSRGNATYHLAVLEAHGFVRTANRGRLRFYFRTGKEDECRKAAALRNPRRRTIAEHLLRNSGCTQRDLSLALGIAPSRVNAHVDTLASVGLIERVAKGRAVLLQPTYPPGAFGLGLA